MHILRWTFLLFTLCGCFPPPSWKTPRRKFLYKIYTVFSLLVLNTFFLCLIMDMIYNVENIDDFSDNFHVTVGSFLISIKVSIILIYRESFVRLRDTLQKEPLLPMNQQEFEILLRFDKITDWNTLGYMTILMTSNFYLFMESLLTYKKRQLTYRTWVPYDYSSASAFLLTLLYQSLFTTICSFGCVATDSLYSGLLIHITCQFEILEHRLKNIESNQNYSVKLCVRHHNHIYKSVRRFISLLTTSQRNKIYNFFAVTCSYLRAYRFGEMVNEEFRTIMFFQFYTSLCMVCFNLYQVTQIEIDSNIIGRILFMNYSLTQIFYYCWFGNEVKLKSLELSDVIFRSDWTSLNLNVKRAFLMLMRRAMRPIEFTSIYVVSVNLESFMTLLKTSYSVFSVFQQSRES
ncbi:odorant receptor Or1-like isoform X1 [Bombus affinis]|uniref:odorant receptor Or1-like isoform X1 n=1 Tax=Bombus affinis TaxID=309941 RepID=UPI0021B7DA62|nr:odorant receptor Or1-like isoform X1 [Bombus affinis]